MTDPQEGYVDVFISHKKEDLAVARRLYKRVKALHYEPYLDDADARLAESASAGELAERIRGRLRRAKCLLYVVTRNAVASKWMPWELGFFDGRWGQPTVGLYTQGRPGSTGRAVSGGFTVQEYLELYEAVDDDGLPAFLERATSGAMLANRRDVDVDRLLTLLSSAGRNPLAFQLGWAQYLLGMLQPFASAVPAWQALLDGQIRQVADWRAAAESAAAASAGRDDATDLTRTWDRWWRDAHAGGVQASAAPGGGLNAPGFAGAVDAARRAVDEAMKGAGRVPG